jgi:hypothetical protein
MTFLVILVTTLHTEPLPNFLGRDFWFNLLIHTHVTPKGAQKRDLGRWSRPLKSLWPQLPGGTSERPPHSSLSGVPALPRWACAWHQGNLTFRRSPPWQYSMANRGKSLGAKFCIPSGTSRAATTLGWLNLGRRETNERTTQDSPQTHSPPLCLSHIHLPTKARNIQGLRSKQRKGGPGTGGLLQCLGQ